MSPYRIHIVTLLIILLALAACSPAASEPTPAAESGAHGREIPVIARDIEFEPTSLTVTVGEPVTVLFENEGALEHDWSVADISAENVDSHTDGASDSHAHDMADAPVLHVAAAGGNSGDITFTPTEAGTYEYYCTVEGHKEAGMVGTLVVEAN